MNEVIETLKTYEAPIALANNNKTIVCSSNINEALLIASAFKLTPRVYLVVKSNLYGAQGLFERLSGFMDSEDILFFPADESFRIEALAASPELLTQRVYVLDKLIEKKPCVIITHTAAMLRILPSKELFMSNKIHLTQNEKMSMDDLVTKLSNCGYIRVNKIDHSLQFALRGGVIDVFSVNNDDPVRIEFFGDEIDSIRFFDLDTQRTKKEIKDVNIIAATDLIVDTNEFDLTLEYLQNEVNNKTLEGITQDEKMHDFEVLRQKDNYSVLYKYYTKLQSNYGCFLDYVDNPKVILSNYDAINDNFMMLMKESYEYLEELNDTSFILHHDLKYIVNKAKNVTIVNEFKKKDSDVVFDLRAVESGLGSAKHVRSLIEQYLKENYRVVFCVDNQNQIDCVKNWSLEWEMDLTLLDKDQFPTQVLSYCLYPLKEGFELSKEKIIYFSALELFGISTRTKKNYTRYKDGIAIKSYDNLSIGDYVVHDIHGIGQFMGIKTIEQNGIHRDYLHIAYRGTDVLYVPLEQFRLIRKYVSKDGAVPKLNKLGSEDWIKTKSKIKGRIRDIADRLIKLYQERTLVEGYAFAKDDDWQNDFEKSFPYELTDDQVRSIEEIKRDMEAPYPMDRLLCGDVGFGKTEVAFCAAFKAIMSGKQVALLCPTTLLAKQHYDTARERFQNFPINIGVLSRYTSIDDEKRYLNQLKDGSLNLVIGTHRLLSNDVKYKDLGLLIVDEEQRFGVEHKEKIKEMKNTIDVLTLSATPIPRTLQMALLGIRNLSQIETPPLNRMPIQTYVVERNNKLINEIITRELGRNGQVFYLHNRVADINEIAFRIEKEIKGAKVIVIHGKMNRDDVEEAMMSFNFQEANVMVCTTIIENGIDIPNANTIIVDDADTFGLAQLYQIKGRVGRGDRLAYAYLLYRPRKVLSEVATKRLRAIKEFAELGSGYRIAMRDLSIRGAGDILGAEQAGFIDSVGMDMYLSLLQETIVEQRTGVPTPPIEVSKPMSIDAYIPKNFTNDDLDKIDLYKEIDEVKDFDSLKELTNKMKDLYGVLPHSVELLLEKRRLEIFIKSELVDEIKDTVEFYEIIFSDALSAYDGIGLDLFSMTSKISRNISITYKQKHIRIKINKKDPKWLDYANTILKNVKEIIKSYPKE